MSSPPLDREQFAVTQHYIYLNHAAVGVLPEPTRRAVRAFADGQATGGVMGVLEFESGMPGFRERIARFIGARGEEIAILRNTSEGANVIARGFPWEPGDDLIVPRNEFPSNLYPWLALRQRGVRVQMPERNLTPDVLRSMLTRRTKVVAVSWVGYADGYRADLAALAEVAHENGSMFCVDVIQGLGALTLDVTATGVDAAYGAGAKWMLALQGAGFLYLRADLLDRLTVASPGWRSVQDMWRFDDHDQPFAGNATRFEGGTPNFIGALSLARSIDVLEAAGTAAVERHVLALTDRLAEGLQACGAQISGERNGRRSSGILTFSLPGADPIALGRALQRQAIVTTYRASGVRVSPHGYNTEDEIDAAVNAVSRFREEELCSR